MQSFGVSERVDADIRSFIRVYLRSHPGVSAARIKYLELEEMDVAAEVGDRRKRPSAPQKSPT